MDEIYGLFQNVKHFLFGFSFQLAIIALFTCLLLNQTIAENGQKCRESDDNSGALATVTARRVGTVQQNASTISGL